MSSQTTMEEPSPTTAMEEPSPTTAMEEPSPTTAMEESSPTTAMEEPTTAANISKRKHDDHTHNINDDDDDGPLMSSSSSPHIAVRYSGHTLRMLLLDLPLFIVLIAYGSLVWMHHVHDTYLTAQTDALIWNSQRKSEEMTYYTRRCDERDITTRNPNDLILSHDATPQQAYAHQRKHGFTVFRDVLSRETATKLHRQITHRNYNLTKDEFIDLHKAENRFGYALGTEEDGVVEALMQVANHEQLTQSMALIMGADPALIELTQITAKYGAEAQPWHPDVYDHASATRHGRAYGPSFSIFIQLQDTTKLMGATGACPGTHYCTDGEYGEMCEEHGIQVVDEELGYWPAGSALVMNMNSWHRGESHDDLDGMDRVMFLLTFAPRPLPAAESRQISAGGTFSNRWDMWGFTWSDLARADTVMVAPWTYLRAFGLYKPRSAKSSWGIDWITSSCMRVANHEAGYDEDFFNRLQKKGGLEFLPRFLQGDFNIEEYIPDAYPWKVFIITTLEKVEMFLQSVSMAAIVGYLVIFIVLSFAQSSKDRRQFIANSMNRLCFLCAFAYLLFIGAQRHVDSTQWAKDIRAGRRFGNSMKNSEDFVIAPVGTSTFPNRHDVLIDNRYGSRHFGMHGEYIQGHYGNVILQDLIQGVSATYAAYPSMLRDASVRYIVDAITVQHGRFLEQGASGAWHWEDFKTAEKFVKKQLSKTSMARLGVMLDEIRHAIDDYRFGVYRSSALASRHLVPFLRDFEQKLLFKANNQDSSMEMTTSGSHSQRRLLARPASTTRRMGRDGKTIIDWNAPVEKKLDESLRIFRPTSSMPSISAMPAAKTSMRTPSFELLPSEPTPGAWFAKGSVVEAVVGDYWYMGVVQHVNARGGIVVEFLNGDVDHFDYDGDDIRPVIPHQVGERVELLTHMSDDDDDDDDDDGPTYELCEIIAKTGDDRYDIIVEEDGDHHDGVNPILFRRKKDDDEDNDDDEDDNEDD